MSDFKVGHTWNSQCVHTFILRAIDSLNKRSSFATHFHRVLHFLDSCASMRECIPILSFYVFLYLSLPCSQRYARDTCRNDQNKQWKSE